MAVTFYDLNSDIGLKKLDDCLLTRSYITGYQASKDDITVYAALSKPPSSEYVNVSRWYNHIDALLRISGVSAEGSGVIVEGSAPIATLPVDDKKASSAVLCSCHRLLPLTMIMMMWICLVRRQKRTRRLLKNAQLPSKHLQRGKNLASHQFYWI